MAINPFLDPAQTTSLYAGPGRIAQRTTHLKAARHRGRDPLEVIVELAHANLPDPTRGHLRILDVGCGRGSSTARLARELRPARLVALDRSTALLAVTRQRATAPGLATVAGDFHRLPLRDRSVDLVVAAFCLYHSPAPAGAVGELARVLHSDGIAILVTKSADSYHSLDQLVAASGLDPQATTRPSLYASFASHNAPDVVAAQLTVRRVVHDEHRFAFPTAAAAAAYLATSPKYHFPATPQPRQHQLQAALAALIPAGKPILTSSTVTYIVATPR